MQNKNFPTTYQNVLKFRCICDAESNPWLPELSMAGRVYQYYEFKFEKLFVVLILQWSTSELQKNMQSGLCKKVSSEQMHLKMIILNVAE